MATATTSRCRLAPAIAAQSSGVEYDGALAAIRRVAVPAVPRSQPTQLVDGGVFDCDGYKSVVLNLAGEVKDPVPKPGKIGAILVPDVEPFTEAFQQLGLLPVTIEIDVILKPGGGAYYMAEPKRADLGFPRYRVLFYNETGAAVTASFFAYRENAEQAWRLQWRGWRCLYVPSATAGHRRGFRPEAGRQGHAAVNRHSVRNRFLLRLHCADLAWHLACLPWWLARDLLVIGACHAAGRLWGWTC